MTILVDKDTRVICQGITGRVGEFHTKGCLEYGTKMVGGVTPGKGGQTVADLPVFDSCYEAVEKVGANATMIFVPPAFTADAILEAVDAGISVITAITEGVPALDMVRVYETVKAAKVTLIGPNCPGLITPEQCKNWHYARLHPQGRTSWSHQSKWNADVRGRLAADNPWPWSVDLCRPWWRPHRWDIVH